MRGATVYRCSDGRYYGDVDVWERFEFGMWDPYDWDKDTKREWVTTTEGEVLLLIPIDRNRLPDRTQVEHVECGVRITAGQEIRGDTDWPTWEVSEGVTESLSHLD